MSKLPDLSTTCRTCLKESCKTVVSVFDANYLDSDKHKLSEILLECASLKISSNDKLPKVMCTDCATIVKNCYRFKQLCHQSELALLELIKKYETSQSNAIIAIKSENLDADLDNSDLLIKEEADNASVSDYVYIGENVEVKLDNEFNSSDDEPLSLRAGGKTQIKFRDDLQCNICNKFYRTKYTLACHIRTQHSDQKIKCEHCIESFSCLYDLEKHNKQTHGMKIKFRRKKRSHIVGEKPYCFICDKYFTSRYNLDSHMKRHIGDKNFKCGVCEKGFITKWDLIRHKRGVHGTDLDDKDIEPQTDSEVFIENQNDIDVQTNVKSPLEFLKNLTRLDFKNGVNCTFCKKLFYVRSDLEMHFIRHLTIKTFKCDLCSETFSGFFELTQHRKTTHRKRNCSELNDTEMNNVTENSDNLVTEFGGREVLKLSDLIKSEAIENEDLHPDLEYVKKIPRIQFKKGVKCDRCPRVLYKRSDMEIHISRHLGIKSFPCQICSKSFVVISDLTRHRKNVHSDLLNEDMGDEDYVSLENQDENDFDVKEEKTDLSLPSSKFTKYPIECKVCLRTFWKKSNYDLHVKRHLGVRKFKCEVCPKKFIARYDLKRHLRTHGKLTGFHCKHCYKSFDGSDELEAHAVEHENDTPHICQECGKQFLRRRSLCLHKAVHTGERPHLCTVCGRAFALSCNLKTHMRIHNGEKPYTCKVCGKAFTQWGSLRSHLPVHSDEKRFVCQTCGKAFRRQNTLRSHLRCHTGVRNFPCSMCDKRFYDSSMLRKHFVVHTGEKNFKCDICNKAFNRSSTLRVHVKIHSGERPFVCTVCGRSFIQKHCLISHMNTHQ